MKKKFRKLVQSSLDRLWNEALGSSSEDTFLAQEGLTGLITDCSYVPFVLSEKKLKWGRGRKRVLKVGKTLIFGTTILVIIFFVPYGAKASEAMNTATNGTLAEEFFEKNPLAGFLLAGLQSQIEMAKKPPLMQQKLPKTKYGMSCKAIRKGSNGLSSLCSTYSIRTRNKSVRIVLNTLAVFLSTVALIASILGQKDD
jgi:hypothetical protein